jgi:hypothetical protein
MKRFQMAQRGSILTSLLASVVAIIALGAALKGPEFAQARATYRREMLVADAFAAELMEYFVSLPSDRFQLDAAADPQLKAVNLCTPYNALIAASNVVSNPVDFAALPPTTALDHTQQRAFRYFQVDVVDIRTQVVRADVCGRRIDQVQLSGRTLPGTTLDLNPGETFQFTVGVSWRSKSDGGATARRVEVVSTSQNL